MYGVLLPNKNLMSIRIRGVFPGQKHLDSGGSPFYALHGKKPAFNWKAAGWFRRVLKAS